MPALDYNLLLVTLITALFSGGAGAYATLYANRNKRAVDVDTTLSAEAREWVESVWTEMEAQSKRHEREICRLQERIKTLEDQYAADILARDAKILELEHENHALSMRVEQLQARVKQLERNGGKQ